MMSDNELKTQAENLQNNLNNLINSEKEKLEILLECLKNLNIIIQEEDNFDNPTELIDLLSNIKSNLDTSRTNISTFEKAVQNLDSSLSRTNKENTISETEQANSETIIEPETEEITVKTDLETNICDNNILLISEIQNKVLLPFSVSELEKELAENRHYKNLQDIIDTKYTVPLDKYKNSALARFREAYNLMRKKEKASISSSLDLALELTFNSLLNPAIITACKNLDELDIYLDYLSSNELDKFDIFEIKYEMLPTK